MLEIPESYTISKQLVQAIKGKTIESVYANSSPHGFAFYSGDPATYSDLLCEKTVQDATFSGGLVEVSLENTKLVFGDGVNVRYFTPDKPTPEKHQLHLLFTDGSSIICTIQMYGGIWAFIDGENPNPYYLVTKEKPSPLTDAFNQAYFASIISNAKPTISVKGLLATEQRIPGLGNGVLQDILFLAKINPKRKLNSLSDNELETLFNSVKNTLLQMVTLGGRDTEKDLFGAPGGYKTILSNKTFKQPCPICSGTITRQAYMGGNVYYCPVCQPL